MLSVHLFTLPTYSDADADADVLLWLHIILFIRFISECFLYLFNILVSYSKMACQKQNIIMDTNIKLILTMIITVNRWSYFASMSIRF